VYKSVPGIPSLPGSKSLTPVDRPLAITGNGDLILKSKVDFTSGVS